MINRQLANELNIKILENPNEIIKNLQIGTSLPILPELHKFILHDLEYFKAKALLLEEDGNPIGNVVIFDDMQEGLYFGFFGVMNHSKEKISYLIDQIIQYAQINNYKKIFGPTNIPAIIFGWGFMKEGSLENLYLGKPVNLPIYPAMFLDRGFQINQEIITWEGLLPRINPWKMKKYDYTDYEYFCPKDFNDLLNYKMEYLRLQGQNLPQSTQLTPNPIGVFDNYAKFVYELGGNYMIFLVRHVPSDKIVACGACLPNIYRKNKKLIPDSVVFYTWAVDPGHRRKGLASLMLGATSLKLWKEKIRYCSGPIAKDNIASTTHVKSLAKYYAGGKYRTHLFFEYEF